jgi:hypothetical protein
MATYENIPGVQITETYVEPIDRTVSSDIAAIIGELDYSFKAGALGDKLQSAVCVTNYLEALAEFGPEADDNHLLNALKEYFYEGGNIVYAIPVGRTCTYLTFTHGGTGAFANPDLLDAAVTTASTGGFIPALTTMYFKVTEYVDDVITGGETTASVAVSHAAGTPNDTHKFTVAHTKAAGADGWRLYISLNGTTWYKHGADITGSSAEVTAVPPTGSTLSQPPVRSEALLTAASANLAAFQSGLDVAKTQPEINLVIIARGNATNADIVTLAQDLADHCNECYDMHPRKRIGVIPVHPDETVAEMKARTTADDRLVVVAPNGVEAYFSGMVAGLDYWRSCTMRKFTRLTDSDLATTYSREETNDLIAAGVTLVEPFVIPMVGGVDRYARVVRGVTTERQSTSPVETQEMCVRRNIDHQIEMLTNMGCDFFQTQSSMNSEEGCMFLEQMMKSYLEGEITKGAIYVSSRANATMDGVAYSISVGEHATDVNKVVVPLALRPSHAIEIIEIPLSIQI